MGDPAGIGPEVILKAIAEVPPSAESRLYIFGDASVLYETSTVMGRPFRLPVVPLAVFRAQDPGDTCVVDFGNVRGRVQFGQERAEYGAAAMQYIQEAVFDCLSGRVDALITGPINKKAIQLAGFDFPGHTEFLAFLTNTPHFAMSFHTGNIWTVLTSTHLPLAEAVRQTKREQVSATIRLAHAELRRYVAEPALAVASLNPHGAEGGLFGMEEELEIVPAVEECRLAGIPVAGPFPADTIYLRALKGDYNIIVTHYHDQGMIPVKLISFGKAVNVTLGLPFIRASVDHGTAFDIAGRNLASAESMVETIRLTRELLHQRGEARI